MEQEQWVDGYEFEDDELIDFVEIDLRFCEFDFWLDFEILVKWSFDMFYNVIELLLVWQEFKWCWF